MLLNTFLISWIHNDFAQIEYFIWSNKDAKNIYNLYYTLLIIFLYSCK